MELAKHPARRYWPPQGDGNLWRSVFLLTASFVATAIEAREEARERTNERTKTASSVSNEHPPSVKMRNEEAFDTFDATRRHMGGYCPRTKD